MQFAICSLPEELRLLGVVRGLGVNEADNVINSQDNSDSHEVGNCHVVVLLVVLDSEGEVHPGRHDNTQMQDLP